MGTHSPRSALGDRDATAVGLGGTVAVLVALAVWTAAVGRTVQYVFSALDASIPIPGTLLAVSGLTVGLGTVLGGIAYARYRDLDIQFGTPVALPTAAAVVVAPAALVAATAVVSNLAVGVPLSDIVQRWMSAEASARSVALISVLPALFVATGYAVLYCGVVHERVRELVAPEDAVPVAAMLVAGFYLLPAKLLSARLSVGGLVEVGVTLVFGGAFGAAIGVLYRRRDALDGRSSPRDLPTLLSGLRLRHLAVLALAGLGLVGIGTELAELPRALGDLLWVAALVVAVHGYDRTRSVWVPAASLAAFQLTITAIVYLEATLGLASL